jgi:hypothetical protein
VKKTSVLKNTTFSGKKPSPVSWGERERERERVFLLVVSGANSDISNPDSYSK